MGEVKMLLRSECRPEDTWNLADIYPTGEDWEAAWNRIAEKCAGYDEFRGRLGESADMLYGCLAFDDSVCEELDRLDSYAFQMLDQDTGNSEAQTLQQKADDLRVKVRSASSFIPVEILAVGEETVDRFMEEDAKLAGYHRIFELIFRDKDHTLSAEAEHLLAEAGSVTEASSNIYKMFNNADLTFPPIENERGETVPVTHGTFISYLENPDIRVRRAAYESVYKTYGAYRNTLATSFQANIRQAMFYAKARKYSSTRAYYLAGSNIPESVYDNLIETVHQNLPSMYHYVALRKKVLGLDQLHLYDVYTPIVKDYEQKYTFEEAKALVKKGLAPMGGDYLNVLQEGFDNRWIDVYENKGKRSGAYSNGVYGVHPYVLLNFNYTLDNVSTLAHEMGHALHSYFSSASQPYCYADYRIFVAEVASTCNEALLNHYLMEHAENDQEKAYIINSYLDTFKGTLFRQTMFAEFEKITHQMLESGQSLTADKICSIYHDLNVRYFGPDMEVDELIDMEWARIPHFYRPFYVYQYATGFSAAIALSQKILTEGAPAVEAYMSFLQGGGSKDPIDLLKMAGVDMNEKAPIMSAMKVFDDLVSRMEELL